MQSSLIRIDAWNQKKIAVCSRMRVIRIMLNVTKTKLATPIDFTMLMHPRTCSTKTRTDTHGVLQQRLQARLNSISQSSINLSDGHLKIKLIHLKGFCKQACGMKFTSDKFNVERMGQFETDGSLVHWFWTLFLSFNSVHLLLI